jgi:hypothetical protein
VIYCRISSLLKNKKEKGQSNLFLENFILGIEKELLWWKIITCGILTKYGLITARTAEQVPLGISPPVCRHFSQK